MKPVYWRMRFYTRGFKIQRVSPDRHVWDWETKSILFGSLGTTEFKADEHFMGTLDDKVRHWIKTWVMWLNADPVIHRFIPDPGICSARE